MLSKRSVRQPAYISLIIAGTIFFLSFSGRAYAAGEEIQPDRIYEEVPAGTEEVLPDRSLPDQYPAADTVFTDEGAASEDSPEAGTTEEGSTEEGLSEESSLEEGSPSEVSPDDEMITEETVTETSDDTSDRTEPCMDAEADEWGRYFDIKGSVITGLQNGGKDLARIVIPDSLGITVIEKNAFRGASAAEIILPSTLKIIGAGAFAQCTSLESVIIPASVTEIGEEAFRYCSSLAVVDIRSTSLTTGGTHAFSGCKISRLILPQGMTRIPSKLFHQASFDNCDIVIPKSVETIEILAFNAIKGVRSFTFEEGSVLKVIDSYAFSDFPLSSIEFPSTLRTIGQAAFQDSFLTEVTLPENLTSVGSGAFEQPSGRNGVLPQINRVTLKSVKINDDYRDNVFYGTRITELVIEDGVTVIPAGLFSNAGFDDVDIVIPSSVKEIHERAFTPSSHVRSVTFTPGGRLTAIGSKGFYEAAFSDVNLPEGLKTIGNDAFRYSALTNVTIPKSVTSIGAHAFDNLKYAGAVRFRVVKGSYAFKWLTDNGFADRIVTADKITYKLNKGTNNAANPDLYVTGDVFMLQAPSRDGYDFGGWFSDAKFKKPVQGITATDTGSKTFYAKWNIINYGITYELYGGTNNRSNKTVYNINKTVSLKAPKKAGYKFEGFYDKEGADGVKITKIKKGSFGDRKVYARWTPIQYKITLKPGKGASYAEDIIIPKTYTVESPDIILPVPAKPGKSFAGWYVKKDLVNYIPAGSAGNKTFTAKWI